MKSSRLIVLGTFAFTLLVSLVHVACTAATAVDSGASELNQNAQSGGNPYAYGDDDDNGYGNGYYGASTNVAPDTAE